jgi:hypothetical protein
MPYKTNDSEGILPVALHKEAIEFAREVTGDQRATREHAMFIETFRVCFEVMRNLGMVKDEYMVAEKDEEE